MSQDTATFRQAFDLLCDQKIGHGMTRVVFSSKILPDCVIKVEEGAGQFQNVIEWETWQRVKDTPASRWFAACKWISPNGTLLVMERTRPASLRDFPEKVPAFLCDFKRTNFGLSQLPDVKTSKPTNTFVCHDYGTNLLFEHGMTKRMLTANWWDE